MRSWIKPIPHQGEQKMLEVSFVVGAGGDYYHVYLDKFYQGAIWKTETYGWQNSVDHPAISLRMVNRIIELIELGEIG